MHITNINPPQEPTIIQITKENHQEFIRFLNQDVLLSRHLDWFTPPDWLGQQPFLAEKHNRQIQAVILAAPDVPGFTWIRLFAVEKSIDIEHAWDRLINKTLFDLKKMRIKVLAALGIDTWFTKLLKQKDFTWQADIAILEWRENTFIKPISSSEVTIRTMFEDDLNQVYQIDQLAFVPQFQNSLQALTKAFNQNTLCTVALKQDQIIGYQISTKQTVFGHLARLAVHPAYHNQHVASMLVYNLLNKFKSCGISNVTVNTQADNYPSLAVYQKFGFDNTGGKIPIYFRQI